MTSFQPWTSSRGRLVQPPPEQLLQGRTQRTGLRSRARGHWPTTRWVRQKKTILGFLQSSREPPQAKKKSLGFSQSSREPPQAKKKTLWAFQQSSREPPKAAAWSCRLDSTVAATKLQRSIHSGICCSACSPAMLPPAALQQQRSVVRTSSADLCSHRSRV